MKKRTAQDTIQLILSKYKHKKLIHQKKGYRTHHVTGAEFEKNISRMRSFLATQKIHKGDSIILYGTPSIEWLTAYFACILSGIVIVPLDTTSDKGFLNKVHSKTGAKLVLSDSNLPKLNAKTFFLDEINSILKNTRHKHLPITNVADNDLLEVMFTSGTTAEPKGVMLTHKNFSAGISSAIDRIKIPVPIRVLIALPFSHIFAQVYGIFVCLHYGCKMYIPNTIQPRKLIMMIRNKRINLAAVVPAFMASIKQELEKKCPRRYLGWQFLAFGVGGASLEPKTEKWWKRHGYKVIQGYGLTETTSVVTSNSLLRTKTKSVGRKCKGMEIKLAEDNEILVKGDNVTPGYYKDKKKTDEAFTGSWFKTGDIGKLKHGELYIKDRKKDIIVTEGGMNVYPTDIEHYINSLEGVKESAVVAKDNKVHAVLILEKGVDPEDIVKKANSKLLGHQTIQGFTVWHLPEFPKTHLGKIKRYLVAEQIKESYPKKYYTNRIHAIIEKVLKPSKRIKDTMLLTKDLNLDSITRVRLIAELEQEFGVELDETAITPTTKVGELSTILKKGPRIRAKFPLWQLSPISRSIRFLGQRFIGTPIVSLYARTKYINVENLKQLKTPVIYVVNHQSAWDAPVVLRKIKQKTAIPAESEYVYGIGGKYKFRTWLYKKITSWLTSLFYNTYPIGKTVSTEWSLEFTGELLDRGYSITIFPEGRRASTGKLNPFMTGVGYMALNMGVPIVPIFIDRLYKVMPPHKLIPKFGKVTVRYGKPIPTDEFKGLSPVKATHLIKQKIEALRDES